MSWLNLIRELSLRPNLWLVVAFADLSSLVGDYNFIFCLCARNLVQCLPMSLATDMASVQLERVSPNKQHHSHTDVVHLCRRESLDRVYILNFMQ